MTFNPDSLCPKCGHLSKPNETHVCNPTRAVAVPEPAAQQERPYDKLYVVEHMRDGKWRMHIGLEVCAVRSRLELKEIPNLQKEWPDAQWRVAEYIPQSCARQAEPAPEPSLADDSFEQSLANFYEAILEHKKWLAEASALGAKEEAK